MAFCERQQKQFSIRKPLFERTFCAPCTSVMGAGTGEQGGQAPTLEKIRVGMAHPGNFIRGLKTSWHMVCQ